VKKEGYQPGADRLASKTRGTSRIKSFFLESLARGLHIASDPPGADVFHQWRQAIGQTPVTLPLAAGQYNLVLRLQGYDPFVSSVQVKDNSQTQISTKLNLRSSNHVAWATSRNRSCRR